MGTFSRRLPKRSWEALEALISKTSWWPNLLAHWAPSGSEGYLRLAIRDGYMNFYSGGQSIAKITFGRGGNQPTLSVHHKYVISHAKGQKNLKCSAEEGLDAGGSPVAWGGPRMLRKWISNSYCYRGEEKRCIENVLTISPKVIDLEMGLPAFNGREIALRMDIVALEPATHGVRLVFWEGKMIGDGRLRSRNRQPEVFKQIDAYRSYLQDEKRKQGIIQGYRKSCRIMERLHGMASRVAPHIGPLDPLISAAAERDSHIEIEEQPRLLVFDDGKKRRADIWQEHLRVLCREVPVVVVGPGTDALSPLEDNLREDR